MGRAAAVLTFTPLLLRSETKGSVSGGAVFLGESGAGLAEGRDLA
jgi:hypothetical protein